ncbi:hypothetical protein LCGC14_0994640 [marine sediment metagenome]|uniref:Uncharacterized protein n=1 Tax=marine sediment metagenome TaxID=412755 RepID=A0A0F9N9D4_9ZZZZ
MKKIIESYNNSLRIASIIFFPSEVNSAPSLPGKTFLELYLEIIPERFSALLFK